MRENKGEGFMKKPILIIVFVALAIRLILAVCLYNIADDGKHGYFYGGDDYGYGNTGILLADEWRKGNFHSMYYVKKNLSISGTAEPFHYYQAVLMYISNNWAFLPILINCLFGALGVLLVYLIAQKLMPEKMSLLAASLCALCPSLIFWSSMNFKSSPTIFLLLLLAYVLMQKKRGARFFNVLLAIVIMYILIKLRPTLTPILVAALFLSCVIWFMRGTPRITKIGSVLVGISIIITLNNVTLSSGNNLPNTIDTYRRDRANGGSVIMPNVKLDTYPRLAKFLPNAISIALFHPLPYKASSPLYLFSIPEMLIWYLLLIPFVMGIVRLRGRCNFILLFMLLFLLSLGYIDSNAGTLYRHRTLILPFSCLFIASGLARESWV